MVRAIFHSLFLEIETIKIKVNADKFINKIIKIMDKFETNQINEKEKSFEQPKDEIGIEVNVISNIPVFTIETDSKEENISKIAKSFWKNTIFRVINSQFIDTAIEFWTDKAHVETHDFRRIADGSGYDIRGVEKEAIKEGFKKSDVFCGIPYEMFIERCSKFDFRGLGIPNDKAAILIYDSEKVSKAEGSEEMDKMSDGYIFKDIEKKKEALIGIIKFKESFTEFEKKLNTLESVDDKITLLEREVFQNVNTVDDLKNAPYLSLDIIALLYHESLNNITSETSKNRIKKMMMIANRLKYEIHMIKLVDNMTWQITMTRTAFEANDEKRMKLMKNWPDFVIEETKEDLQNMKLDKKYTTILQKIIKDATRCKEELKIQKNDNTQNIQETTKIEIKNNLLQQENSVK